MDDLGGAFRTGEPAGRIGTARTAPPTTRPAAVTGQPAAAPGPATPDPPPPTSGRPAARPCTEHHVVALDHVEVRALGVGDAGEATVRGVGRRGDDLAAQLGDLHAGCGGHR